MPYKDTAVRKQKSAERWATWAEKNPEERRAMKHASKTAWATANPEKVREGNRWAVRKFKYGITRDQYESMWTAQNERCASCGTQEPGRKDGWSVDHCHKTGKVRGIVCHQCNMLAGYSRDTPKHLRLVALYLEQAEGKIN